MIQPPAELRISTARLSRRLAGDLTPTPRVLPQSAFLGIWFAASIAFFLPGLLIAPTRLDLVERLGDWTFLLETALWVFSATLSAVMVYRSSIPGMMRRAEHWLCLIPLMTVIGLWVTRLSTAGIYFEFMSEMSLWRGRCGFVIVAVGLGAGALLFRWTRKAAPTRPGITGIWAALCAGSLGSFGMQIVCAHDNALHLWIWHIAPVALLALCGFWLGMSRLSWGGKRPSA